MNDMATKDWIQYSTAIAMIASGIILSFMSFFWNNGDIAEGVLWYMAQALTYAGSIFGVSIYFNNKLGAFESRARDEIIQAIEDAEQRGERKRAKETDDIEPLDIKDM